MEKPHSPGIKKGASYPKEFREEAVRYWLSSGKKASVVAQELGVSDWSLSRWRHEMEEFHAVADANTSQVNALELAKENGRLRRENEALLRQREVLEKALDENPELFSLGFPPFQIAVREFVKIFSVKTFKGPVDNTFAGQSYPTPL